MTSKSEKVERFRERALKENERHPSSPLKKDDLNWAVDRMERQSKETGVPFEKVVDQWIDRLP